MHDDTIRRRIFALPSGMGPIPTMELSGSLAPFTTVIGGALRLQADQLGVDL